MPQTEEFPSTPPAFQDEGYGHGISIDSMIVTPRVPILGESLPNIGTNKETESSKVPQSSSALDVLKHAVMTIEKELEDQALERRSLSTLAEERQQRIQTLESLLECERTACGNLQQDLKTANDELVQLREEKTIQNQNYSEALKKVEEIRALFQQAQEKIETLEAELIVEKTAITSVENLLKKKDEEIRMAERALRDQSAEVENLKKKCADVEALEAKVAALEKVS